MGGSLGRLRGSPGAVWGVFWSSRDHFAPRAVWFVDVGRFWSLGDHFSPREVWFAGVGRVRSPCGRSSHGEAR
jgi:hypothetical protein